MSRVTGYAVRAGAAQLRLRGAFPARACLPGLERRGAKAAERMLLLSL